MSRLTKLQEGITTATWQTLYVKANLGKRGNGVMPSLSFTSETINKDHHIFVKKSLIHKLESFLYLGLTF